MRCSDESIAQSISRMGLCQGFAKLRLTFVISWGDIVSVVGFSTDLAYSLYSRFQFGVGRSLRRTAVVSRLSPPNAWKRKSCDMSHDFLDGSTVLAPVKTGARTLAVGLSTHSSDVGFGNPATLSFLRQPSVQRPGDPLARKRNRTHPGRGRSRCPLSRYPAGWPATVFFGCGVTSLPR